MLSWPWMLYVLIFFPIKCSVSYMYIANTFICPVICTAQIWIYFFNFKDNSFLREVLENWQSNKCILGRKVNQKFTTALSWLNFTDICFCTNIYISPIYYYNELLLAILPLWVALVSSNMCLQSCTCGLYLNNLAWNFFFTTI